MVHLNLPSLQNRTVQNLLLALQSWMKSLHRLGVRSLNEINVDEGFFKLQSQRAMFDNETNDAELVFCRE